MHKLLSNEADLTLLFLTDVLTKLVVQKNRNYSTLLSIGEKAYAECRKPGMPYIVVHVYELIHMTDYAVI